MPRPQDFDNILARFKIPETEQGSILLSDALVIGQFLRQRAYYPHAVEAKAAYEAWKRLYRGLMLESNHKEP